MLSWILLIISFYITLQAGEENGGWQIPMHSDGVRLWKIRCHWKKLPNCKVYCCAKSPECSSKERVWSESGQDSMNSVPESFWSGATCLMYLLKELLHPDNFSRNFSISLFVILSMFSILTHSWFCMVYCYLFGVFLSQYTPIFRFAVILKVRFFT